MNVLVLSASKHGSTDEIAQAIGDLIASHGIETIVMSVDDIYDIDYYDAIVLGSAVYAGHWLKSARRFVDEHAEALASKPVWLFSSGPIGTPPHPSGNDAVDVSSIMKKINARDHWVFAGKLDKSKLNFTERAVILAVRAHEGDFRNWKEIHAWATTIARQLIKEFPRSTI
jgi:menaquinone-dependent protoporphyrinogen oxidase